MKKFLVISLLLLGLGSFAPAQDVPAAAPAPSQNPVNPVEKSILKETIKLEIPKETLKTEPAEKAVPREEPSPLEAMFEKESSLKVSKEIRQFGYDIFQLPSSTFAPVENVPVGPDYILGPGDTLNIYVWGNEQQVFPAAVDRDGKIVLPQAGVLHVWGLQFSEAEKLIKNALGKVFANVQIDVSMGKLRTIKVFVLGEAKKAGGYTVSSLSTLFQALYEAGGPTKIGTLRKIKLIRDKKVVDVVDLYKFLLKGDKSQDYKLFSNDTIFIPPIGQVAAIAGYVKKPGIYELSGPTKISDLISLAGGIVPTAWLNHLQVERIKAHEKRVLLDLEFKTAAEIDKSLKNLTLEDGDVVMVHPILPYKRNFVSIEGNVLRPGEYELTEGMRISDLIRKAEGVLNESYQDRAEILRFKSDYTREPIPFNLEKVLRGDSKENIPLQEWDTVKVYSIYDIYPEPMVEIRGSVNKPGVYRFVDGMTLLDLIFRGGNLAKECYLERAELFHLREDAEREVAPVNLRELLDGKEGTNFILKPWDKLQVYSLYDILPTGYVSIEGAVYKPGSYELSRGMRVGDLIFQANTLKKDAYLQRAEIYRFRKDKTRAVLAVDLNKILRGDEKENFLLEDKDQLRIYAIGEVIPKSYVEISGAVYKPGRYELATEMKISDLLFTGGGKNRTASPQAELYRQAPGGVPQIVKVNLETVGKEPSADLILQEEDHLFVRYESEWVEKNKIILSGEIKYPGEYVSQKGETLLDIIRRAGGFTEKAYPAGAVFTRQSVKEIEKRNLDKFVEVEQKKILNEETNLTGLSLSDTEKKERQESLVYRKKILDTLARIEIPGRITINLARVLDPGDAVKYNVLIENGDSLYVPQTPSSVQILGAVHNSGAVLFEPGRDIAYYLDKVGGLTQYANAKGIYVIRASGETIGDQIRFKNRIERGDTIIIPEEFKFKTPAGLLVRDIAQVIYQLGLPVAAFLK